MCLNMEGHILTWALLFLISLNARTVRFAPGEDQSSWSEILRSRYAKRCGILVKARLKLACRSRKAQIRWEKTKRKKKLRTCEQATTLILLAVRPATYSLSTIPTLRANVRERDAPERRLNQSYRFIHWAHILCISSADENSSRNDKRRNKKSLYEK